jgi:hypothetical protein
VTGLGGTPQCVYAAGGRSRARHLALRHEATTQQDKLIRQRES